MSIQAEVGREIIKVVARGFTVFCSLQQIRMCATVGNVVVTGLNIFPVKSCRAVPVQEVEFDSYGVVGDRRFMVVDGNRFTTQRKLPRLALVTVRYSEREEGRKQLHFSAPGAPDFILEPISVGERMEVEIWKDTVCVIDQGDAISQWLNGFIGMGSAHLRLVATAEKDCEGYCRPVSQLPAKLQDKLSEKHLQVCLADSGPVSLVSHESLVDLNTRLKEREAQEVDLRQFRMNIEISGCSEAFEEDKWLLLQIGNVPFFAYRNATRCKVTGINQETAEQLKVPPLDILRTYRAPQGPAYAKFGQLLLPLKTGGKIKIGDKITVLEYRK